MRLLFIADGRSPIALNWMHFFLQREDEVHLVSTFPCDPDPRFATYTFLPVAFSTLKKKTEPARIAVPPPRSAAPWHGGVRFRTMLRQWFGALTLGQAARRLRALLERLQPELVHAMRIPYEGMLAALGTGRTFPLLVSVWGNDFTLHAPSTPWMAHYTRLALRRADALHTDCFRDLRLAREWGFEASRPSVVLPGAGGVQREIFYPPSMPVSAPCAINPRGFRAYVNNKAFFQAIPLVLAQQPEALFLCPAMEGEPQAWRWIKELNIEASVELLPMQTRPQMAELFRRSRLAISPSTHDGTPNTLLEAMACGCVPIAGDLESLREWIEPGKNGLLADPNDPRALAQAILSGLEQDDLQQRAREINTELIAQRAEHGAVMRRAGEFYQVLIQTG